MVDPELTAVLGYFRRMAAEGVGVTDAELLSRYAGSRDEAAFELLVWRHAPLVFGVCRRILHDIQDAEDAFQATFLALARQAGRVKQRAAVAGWLYQVARRTALTARARRERRAAREQSGRAAEELPAPSDASDRSEQAETRAIVDEEVSRLPDRLRTPVILCYFEGKTVDEAARLLDCPRGTVASRLARARERLRHRLVRRGLAVAAGLAVVPQAEAGALSRMLPLIRVVVRQASGKGAAGAIPSRVADLTREVLRAMFYQKLKAGSAVLALCGGILLAGGTLALRLPARAQEEPQPPKVGQAQKEPKAPTNGKAEDKPAAPAAEPAPVTVIHPVRREFTPYQEYPGRLVALQSVDVRAPVSGTLKVIQFKPGTEVKKGDLLFIIDTVPYQLALEKAQAALALAEAQRNLSAAEAQRAKRLLDAHGIAKEEYDKALVQMTAAGAAIKGAQVEVEQARRNLTATNVHAPAAGRIGLPKLEPGSLVSGGGDHATLLATITALDPIGLTFEMDENSYLRYQRLLREKEVKGTGSALAVRVADEKGFPHEGALDGFDHQVNPNTGTVRIRGRMPNPGGLLLPGMFATVRMAFGRPRQVIEVPAGVLRYRQDKPFVLVINEHQRLEWREVQVGETDGDRRVIKQGLKPEDWVIVGGERVVEPGDRVQPKRLTAPERPAPDKD